MHVSGSSGGGRWSAGQWMESFRRLPRKDGAAIGKVLGGSRYIHLNWQD
ncbi:hypothetical protein E2C01_101293 [Portunus trituberculatus]|uniref:Uncharacterized protein n=1 Tax=Portunus trituberculatus TaxID=210409 RepID=A0A5B7KFG7_PORTR|nr:hypothetical protein [Portunus trituberculatus]